MQLRGILPFLLCSGLTLVVATGCDEENGGPTPPTTLCGNGAIDGSEQCDGSNVAGNDCVGLGAGAQGSRTSNKTGRPRPPGQYQRRALKRVRAAL